MSVTYTKRVKNKSEYVWDLPGGPVVKNPPAKAGDMVWSLVLEDSPCFRATKSKHQHYQAYTLHQEQPAMSSPITATRSNSHLLHLEQTWEHQWRPGAAKAN